jgi:hypothetical protein
MSEQPPIQIISAEQPSDEQKQFIALFNDMENRRLDFLDEAGKSVIERTATFLAILFAVTAFGGNFPPKYLVGNPWDKYLVIAILGCYLLAMGMGMWAIQLRRYKLYRYNLTEMKNELERMMKHKTRWVQWAGILFAIGTVALAGLIVSIIWTV